MEKQARRGSELGEKLDLAIQQKEEQLLPLNLRMSELKDQFIKETSRFAIAWYPKTAKQYIAKYPNIMLGLSEEQVTRMKTEIDSLTMDGPKKVREVLDNPVLWWHLNLNTNSSIERYTQLASKYPEALDQAVRQALGPLGLILEEFKFHVSTNRNRGTFDEFWFAEAIGRQETVPSYPHLLTWSDDMEDTIRQYNSAYTKAMKIFHEIQLLKDEKKKLQALTRWDNTK